MVYDFLNNNISDTNSNVGWLNFVSANPITYEALKQGLDEVYQSGFWCYGGVSAIQDYYKNPSNYPFLLQAYNKWGGFPTKNRPSYKNKGLFGKWNDFCDFADFYGFIFYAKLSKDFPTFQSNDTTACYKIEGLLESLQAEKTNSNKRYAAGGGQGEYQAEIAAIDKKLTEYNTLYSTLACDVFKQKEIDDRAADERAKAELSQKALLADTFANAKKSEAETNKIAIYAAIGVGVVITGLVVIRAFR